MKDINVKMMKQTVKTITTIRVALASLIILLIANTGFTQTVDYAYPVHYYNLKVENENVRMAFMDVPAKKPNGKTAVLFHGKNFSGFYWKEVINLLSNEGYRVIVPDQLGFGKSSKPNVHYSFHMLANNTRLLLDSLKADKVTIIAHSMGGMLATRFALMFPERVTTLIMENPIGLEDYKTFVPYRTIEELYKNELSATYESYKKYQQSYYPVWKEAYEPLVAAQAEALKDPNFPAIAWANALTYQMIYEQPVVYEFNNLKMPVLLMIGQEDRTVVGKNLLSEEQKKVYGNYPQLGRKVKAMIKKSTLVELPGVGHIPHIQSFDVFQKHLLNYLHKQ